MLRRFVVLTALVAVILSPRPATAQDQPVAFVGAAVYPISSVPIADGTVVIHHGRIVAIGQRQRVPVPAGALVVDASGKVLMPGLVDTHSHVGEGDGGDRSAALHPDVRILDAIDPTSDTFAKARAGGITTVNVMPGSGHLMSGQTVYLKPRHARTIEDMLVCDASGEICGGLKMANGTNSIRTESGPFPNTRARSAAMVRELFVSAQAHRDKLASGEQVERNLGLETLVEVLEGRRIVHFHTHRTHDILTVIRLAEEFGFRPVLHHVSEGWAVADEIAASGLGASIIVLDAPGGKHEATRLYFETGGVMERAGVDVAYHTDDWVTDSRLFLRSAALGVRAGMSRDGALEALTLAGARMLGMEDRVGSLEVGKDADLVLLSGDPLSVYTHVEQTWIDGEKVFDRSDPADRAFATGGYNVFRAGAAHSHHHDH
jgi:imidazolonepropionase-like amidohydrolase